MNNIVLINNQEKKICLSEIKYLFTKHIEIIEIFMLSTTNSRACFS